MKNVSNMVFAVALSANILTLSGIAKAAESTSLRPYYVYYLTPGTFNTRDNLVTGFPPEVRVVGGGVDPPNIINSAGSFAPVDRMMAVGGWFENPNDPRTSGFSFAFNGPLTTPCAPVGIRLPWAFSSGYQLSQSRSYYRVGSLSPPTSMYCKDYDIQTIQYPTGASGIDSAFSHRYDGKPATARNTKPPRWCSNEKACRG